MSEHKTDLSAYNNSWYRTGAGKMKMLLWFYVNNIFFVARWMFIPGFKVPILRLFGAKVGKGVIIKPGVNIKYPWKLEIGDYVWIGENVWIDNLDNIRIGNHVCISQGAMLLCGNHNYSETTFGLITAPIILEDGVWVGARAVVCPGVTCHSHSVLTVQSVAAATMDAYGIYKGNPAVFIKKRMIK